MNIEGRTTLSSKNQAYRPPFIVVCGSFANRNDTANDTGETSTPCVNPVFLEMIIPRKISRDFKLINSLSGEKFSFGKESP